MEEQPKVQLLTLPPEIREEVYRLILSPDANRCYHEDEYTSYNYAPALTLFHVNRQVYLESRKIFRDLNIFVRVETPWPEAQQHVALEGHVPIIVTKNRAVRFEGHSMTVGIDVPEHGLPDWNVQHFIILLDDLDKFTRMWFYADLTHPGLNAHLRLEVQLRDPFTPDWEEKTMPKALQRKMLLPFGEIKNLNQTVIIGDVKPYGTIEQELHRLQAQPYMSPAQCLREATRLKFEGNAELANGRYHAALKLYDEAWRAMHIVIKGRRRHVHADTYFNQLLHEEPFQGKNGASERLILRVHLVANTCHAYLKLCDYETCQYWGMRSINTLRDHMRADGAQGFLPEDEAMPWFPAADQLGKIYYRTAVAYKMLDDMSTARELLRLARIYLPRDESIKKEIAATALKLG